MARFLGPLLRRRPFREGLFTRPLTPSRQFAAPATESRLKVLFSTEHFRSGFEFTKQALRPEHPSIVVVNCNAETFMEGISDADVAVPGHVLFSRPVLESAKKLKLILQYGVGLEGVDMEAASEFGIWVSNIPSYNTPNALSCAEHAVYLMMALLRNQKEMQKSIENRILGSPLGDTLFGKRVVVIGFGGIAQQLIRRLKPFHLHIIGARRQPWTDLSPEEQKIADLLDEKHDVTKLADVLPTIDFVVLACVQNAETMRMINGKFLAQCRDGVKIVNVCRGGLLDEAATLQYLRNGKIGGLGLDVQWFEPFDPNHEISKHPNVILTPHVAGVTEPSYRVMAEIVAREVRLIKSGKEPTIIVNRHLLQH